MSYIARFKKLADQALKHVQRNAMIYVNLIGAISQDDYATAFTWFKVLALRTVIGEFQSRIEKKRTKDDDDSTKK